MTITITGTREIERILRQLGERAPREAAKALYETAEEIMADSKENYCPVDTGNLRGTGNVQQPAIGRNDVSVELGYNADYAAVVHELLDVYHPVGQAKFLETPISQTDITGKLAEKLRSVID